MNKTKGLLLAVAAAAMAFNICGCYTPSGRDTLAFDKERGLFVSDKTKCSFGNASSAAVSEKLSGECSYYGAKITKLRSVTNLRTGQTAIFNRNGISKSSAGFFLNDIQEGDQIIVDFKYKSTDGTSDKDANEFIMR